MTPRRADLSLLLCTAIWASTFVIVKDAVDADLSPLCYLALRMIAGAALMVALRPSLLRESASRAGLVWGGSLGVFYFLGIGLQTIGIRETTPARSAFISALAVVLVPFLETAITRRLPARSVLAALPVSVLGLALLSDPWSAKSPYPAVLSKLNAGDLWTLASAGFFTAQLVLAERATKHATTGALALVQVAVCGALCLGGTVALEMTGLMGRFHFAVTPRSLLAITVTSFFATTLAFLLWLAAQKATSASRAALIFTLEPVFAAALSRALDREALSGTQYAGGGLIVLAVLLAELRNLYQDPPS